MNSIAVLDGGWIDRPLGYMKNGMFMNEMVMHWKEERGRWGLKVGMGGSVVFQLSHVAYYGQQWLQCSPFSSSGRWS